MTCPGTLNHIRYDIVGGGSVTIATTRPETMLGDTAVAVHPDDERYKDVVGKTAVLPLLGTRAQDRGGRARRPGIRHRRPQDHAGARPHRLRHRPHARARVRPGHRPGRPHHRGRRPVRGAGGRGGRRARRRGPARARRAREGRGLPAQRRHLRPLRHAHRAADQRAVVHGHGRAQEPATDVVREGKVKFTPERWGRVYVDWMDNLRPWCISRQLWWGHQLPVWYCPDGQLTVAEIEPQACAECGSTELTRETDVLDTWFSSALWPFATWAGRRRPRTSRTSTRPTCSARRATSSSCGSRA